jgi:hypothetical protein
MMLQAISTGIQHVIMVSLLALLWLGFLARAA